MYFSIIWREFRGCLNNACYSIGSVHLPWGFYAMAVCFSDFVSGFYFLTAVVLLCVCLCNCADMHGCMFFLTFCV